MSGRLSGKACVITGTGGSMGRATALAFARGGAWPHLKAGRGVVVNMASLNASLVW